jgi:hypothetical protein
MAISRSEARRRKNDELEAAFEKLERETPDFVCRTILWLRKPKARWVRWPLAILFIAGGLMWFMPVVGLEMLPIGLLLIAQDVPFLRRPVGRATLWLLDRWVQLRKWWQRRRQERQAHSG